MFTTGQKSANGSEEMRMRAGTWTDAELEELYDVKMLNPENALKMIHLLQMMKAIRHCNKAPTLDAAISVTVQNTCKIMGCDRATLFIVDEIREELVIRQAVGVKDIRLPLDENSIAGAAYHSGAILNIPNAYEDPRFNSATDQATGYKTKSILCVPIRDANFQPVAVLQAVNKLSHTQELELDSLKASRNSPSLATRLLARHGHSSGSDHGFQHHDKPSSHHGEAPLDSDVIAFTKMDEVLMDHLSLQLGVILRNQMLREKNELAHKQVLSMLDIVRSLHSNMGINSLMFTITERIPSLVDADRCTLYVLDRKHHELWSLQGAMEVRVPSNKGLIGHTALTGEIINIEDAHKDPRFNTEYDIKTGFRTKSVLVMPITDRQIADVENREPEVIGVMQVINKLHGSRFIDEDEHLLSSFLDIVGGIVSTSQLFSASQVTTTTEFGAASDLTSGSPMSPVTKRHGSTGNIYAQQNSINEVEEGEEEEEEEEEEEDEPFAVSMDDSLPPLNPIR
mmetsp:Transcript_4542/g.7480  ORF Transcript_4542/g.7480 Transcript_4542/m.7480 type:complete len:511 (+) Transcript_4542:510-2042(+)|eukprot:CAMPEP_0171491704 /NCGR_PEP_ID=MMETSP0958-20121227/4002_1 /TAXON_ID=87120 /ORGANISM="Aurantiochytrium limacinum, Strain ATCCMYA-1381" /LENGTH=510 /DNA_ID=CAMNT_0012025141 /DNA_START=410 /DNA_END=1942 /DNA_ORIENTATION=-